MVGDPVAVVHGECVQNAFPAGDPPGHVLTILPSGGRNEVENFHRGLFVREMASVRRTALRNLAFGLSMALVSGMKWVTLWRCGGGQFRFACVGFGAFGGTTRAGPSTR